MRNEDTGKEPRWTVELWDINGGGSSDFYTKAEALKEFNSMKAMIRKDYPEYKWETIKVGGEMFYRPIGEGYGEQMVLGDMELYE